MLIKKAVIKPNKKLVLGKVENKKFKMQIKKVPIKKIKLIQK